MYDDKSTSGFGSEKENVGPRAPGARLTYVCVWTRCDSVMSISMSEFVIAAR